MVIVTITLGLKFLKLPFVLNRNSTPHTSSDKLRLSIYISSTKPTQPPNRSKIESDSTALSDAPATMSSSNRDVFYAALCWFSLTSFGLVAAFEVWRLQIFWKKLMWTRLVEWIPVTTAWRVLRLRIEERPPIRRVAANKLNKQSRTADEGWSSSLGVGRGANNPSL